MQENSNRLKTLILGSSHAYAAVNPEMLDSAFNLANSSQRLEYDYFLLTRYYKHCKNLKNVILTIDCYNMFLPAYEEGASDWNRVIYYHIYMGNTKHHFFSKYSWELGCNTMLLSKLKSLIKYAINGKIDIQCDSLGMSTSYRIENKRKDDMGNDYSFALWKDTNVGTFSYNAFYLQKIADFCEANNIHLIAITPPFGDSFRAYAPQSMMRMFRHEVRKVQRNHLTFEYQDLASDSSFVEEDFFNANHLSDLGAEKLTKKIKRQFRVL